MKYREASEYVSELTSTRPSDIDASSNEKAEPVELSIYFEAWQGSTLRQ